MFGSSSLCHCGISSSGCGQGWGVCSVDQLEVNIYDKGLQQFGHRHSKKLVEVKHREMCAKHWLLPVSNNFVCADPRCISSQVSLTKLGFLPQVLT